jgi:competence protein ComEC
VWIGITPVLIHYFNYVSIINILLNVAAVPISFLITLAGFAGVVVGMIAPVVSVFVFSVSYYLIRLLYFISEKALLLPGAGFSVPSLSWYIYVIYYAAALLVIDGLWRHRSILFKRRYYSALAVSIGVAVLVSFLPESALKINYIDVGQGDSSLIRTPGRRTILIDGGGNSPWQSGGYDIGQKLTVPALLRLGVWKIDAVIISHIHDDHIGGALAILDKIKVDRIIMPESDRYGKGEFVSDNYNKLLEKCKLKKIPISYLEKGDRIMADKALSIDVLGPGKPFISNTDSDVNNNSLVLKLKYKDFDALFVGDIQLEGEQRIINSGTDIDVLKTAHHGSRYSTTKEFLDLVKPEYSIISVGKNNYGHPSGDVLERLKEGGSNIYRTDEKGGIMLITDGHSMRVKTVR